MYIDAVCHGIDDLPDADMEIRKKVIEKYNKEGIESLRRELKLVDPLYYASVDLKNPKRIFKALEIFYITGKPYSSFLTRKPKLREFNVVKIGLNMDREKLYERINNRVDNMIKRGLVEEAKTLYPNKDVNALNTVGYKEIFDYLDGHISFEKAVELVKRNTRHYARRQITWFNKDKDINWFKPDQAEEISDLILKKIELDIKKLYEVFK